MSHGTHNRIVFTKAISGTFLALCLFLGGSTAKGDWKSDANARIEQNRKRNAQITVVDMNGQPVQDINVQIAQVKHSFAFGTCIAYTPLNSNANYRNFILNHFEWAVCENESKWPANEPSRDSETYTQADYIYNWCNTNGITMRGHTLFWEQTSMVPSWATSLSCTELQGEVNERIDNGVGHFKDKFRHWDVDNEMLSNDFYGTCLGNPGRADMFKRANTVDPNCKLFMNEYNGNSFGGYDAGPYVTRANQLIALGAPIHGIGIQGHVNSPFDPVSYWTNVLEPLRTGLGLPIWVTEYDSSTTNVTQRATDLENFYRICFSHSSVEGILMWGFWDGSQWRADAQLVETDWTVNEAGLRYESLLNEWTTNDANYTDPNGKVNFRGFHGSYEITLSAPGQTAEVHAIELAPGTTPLQFTLATGLHSPVPEFNAPTPNPMTWSTAPTAIGASSITMTAATAADETPPVQYYFECTNHGEANSTWQTSSTYIAQGLTPSTLYSFRVKARDSASSHNETGWSNILSATTQPPGTDVNIVGSWATGTSHTKENGYNRALIFIAHEESISGTPTLTSVSYGGQAMTKVIEISAVSGYGNYVAAFILNESGVAAATNNTFVPTWSATTSSVAYASVFLQNVNQTTSIGATASNSTTSSTPNPITTAALATNAGDMVIVGVTCGNNGSYTLNSGFTEGTDQSVGTNGLTGAAGYKLATGAAETPSATYNTGPNRQAIIGFVVQAAQIPPTYPDCNAVQAGGYQLASDLNGDCYVDLPDLGIIAYYWLHTDCIAPGNCQGADFAPTDGVVDFFDFSDFGPQWRQCNNPQDAGCAPNW